MFKYMTGSQIAALIFGIIFSIASIATTFLAMKYSKKINSPAKNLALVLGAPFVAGTSWLFLIFSFLDGFRKDDLLNVVISTLISLFVVAMIIIVSKALYAKNEHNFKEEDAEVKAEEEIIEGEKVEEIPAEEGVVVSNEDIIKATIIAEELKNQEKQTVEEKPAEQVAPVQEKAKEEKIEEVKKETAEVEAVEEIEEVEASAPEVEEEIEDEQIPMETEEEAEVEAEEEEIKPIVLSAIKEEPTDNAQETQEEAQETEDEEEEMSDEDKEFEKFLESLKRRTEGDDQE